MRSFITARGHSVCHSDEYQISGKSDIPAMATREATGRTPAGWFAQARETGGPVIVVSLSTPAMTHLRHRIDHRVSTKPKNA
jgi:hypothetical protein